MSEEKSGFPDVFVKGGTTTSAYDRMVAAQEADAERRRNVEAERHRLARDKTLLQREGAVAGQSTMNLGGKSLPVIVLAIKHPKDSEIKDWIICELSMQGDPIVGVDGSVKTSKVREVGDVELVLIVACPVCAKSPNRLKGENYQMTIRSTQKRMEFHPKKGPAWNKGSLMWANPVAVIDEVGRPRQEILELAGSITVSEKCGCPGRGCTFAFRIDDSLLIPA